jgi:hypothetical protein
MVALGLLFLGGILPIPEYGLLPCCWDRPIGYPLLFEHMTLCKDTRAYRIKDTHRLDLVAVSCPDLVPLPPPSPIALTLSTIHLTKFFCERSHLSCSCSLLRACLKSAQRPLLQSL